MKKPLISPKTLAAACVGVAGMLLVLYAWQLPPFHGTVRTTENAYVRGQATLISPQLAGYVTEVAVQDFQTVRKGELLLRIDDRIPDQRLRQARAALAGARAGLANFDQDRRAGQARIGSSRAEAGGARAALAEAEANARRIERLLQSGVVSQSAVDQARATLERARAAVLQADAATEVSRQDLQGAIVNRQALEAAVESAEAAVRQAEIDLQNTRIVAPADGKLGEIGVRLGQYVAAGTQLTTLVPDRKWIVANFKENQVYGMRIGQPVRFTADALPHAVLRGHIAEFSPATGSEFSVLKPDNATGNFTKVAQRLPVRISIDAGQPQAALLVPGMSVVVRVDTAAAVDAGSAAVLPAAGSSRPQEASAPHAVHSRAAVTGGSPVSGT